MKKIISLLISVCMLISLVPTIVFAGPIYFNDGDFKYRTNTAETAAIIVGLQDGVTVTDLVLPSSVTYGGKTFEVYAIDNSAFADNLSLESVYMPDTYTTLLINTFYGCRNLKEVTLSNNLTGTMQGTFQYCSSLKECVIPSGVTTLTNTFKYCTSLEKLTVPASVTSVSAIFDGCNKAMSTINVIAPVGSTAETIFRNLGCTMNDEGNEPEEPDTPVITHPAYFADGDFKYRTNSAGTKAIVTGLNDDVVINNLVLPESVTYSGTTYEVYAIDNDAFANNTDIESVYIPDTYTTILTNVFHGCRNLRSVRLSANLTGGATAGQLRGTFKYCTNLESVTLPTGITECYGTFQYSGVKNVIITGKGAVNFYADSGTADARAWSDNTTGIMIFYPEGGAEPTRTTGYGIISTVINKTVTEMPLAVSAIDPNGNTVVVDVINHGSVAKTADMNVFCAYYAKADDELVDIGIGSLTSVDAKAVEDVTINMRTAYDANSVYVKVFVWQVGTLNPFADAATLN